MVINWNWTIHFELRVTIIIFRFVFIFKYKNETFRCFGECKITSKFENLLEVLLFIIHTFRLTEIFNKLFNSVITFFFLKFQFREINGLCTPREF